MTLFSMILTRSILAVGVPTSPGNLIRLPPITRRVLCLSAFWGRSVHSNFPYVTSLNRSGGTCPLAMKWHVLVGSFILLPTPWKSRPNSLADDVLHVSLMIGSSLWISCRCFNILPELMSITARAAPKMAGGNFRLARRLAFRWLLSTKHAANIAFSRAECDFDRVLLAGPWLNFCAAAVAARVLDAMGA